MNVKMKTKRNFGVAKGLVSWVVVVAFRPRFRFRRDAINRVSTIEIAIAIAIAFATVINNQRQTNNHKRQTPNAINAKHPTPNVLTPNAITPNASI
jgi:hypothetical protein